MPQDFRQIVQAEMDRRGLSQRGLVAEINHEDIKPVNLHYWLTGRNDSISSRKLELILEHLGFVVVKRR